MNFFLKMTAGTLVVGYPFIVYWGLEYLQPRYLALVLAVILAIRFYTGKVIPGKEKWHFKMISTGLGVAVVISALLSNSVESLKVYPLIVNFSLMVVFGYSLKYPPSTIEMIARLSDPELPPSGVDYTRSVTKIWCGFFLLNGLLSLATMLYGSLEVWTFYNGFLSYVIMGSLLGGELLYRKLVIKK
jgi:uncharacterized membrane protein